MRADSGGAAWPRFSCRIGRCWMLAANRRLTRRRLRDEDFGMGVLKGQIAVVTGAGRGLGNAIALQFAAAGADVVCVSRSLENAGRAAQSVRALGRNAWPVAMDIADASAIQSGVRTILETIERVDVLVNNAGVTRDGLLMRMSEEDWDAVLDINLKGAFLLSKEFARLFMKQRKGRIINIGSVVGLAGNAGQANYAASKAGLVGMTKSVARELATRGVTANVIAPGFIQTDMTAKLNEKQRTAILAGIPMGFMGKPEDVAQAALFLAGPGGRYITGQVLTVDGGMRM